jgi:hypothetical protein
VCQRRLAGHQPHTGSQVHGGQNRATMAA